MYRKILIATLAAILMVSRPVYAGEFYKLYPSWLELLYHILSALFIVISVFVSYLIFKNFKGGKLGLPWIFIIISLLLMLVRSIMSLLTIFDIQYFQALAFAGLDIMFFILLLIGLILYKVGLE
jgi:hypothetical protein